MAYPYLSDLIEHLTGLDLPLPLPMFGLMVAVALLVAIQVTTREVARMADEGKLPHVDRKVREGKTKRMERVPPDEIIPELGVVGAVAGIIGARLFHILEYPGRFLQDPWGMIFARGGLTIYGGLIFGTVAGIYYVRKKGLPLGRMMDAVAPAMMLAYGIGRIGCQLAGDGDWGIQANMALKPDWLPGWFFAQTYENNILGVDIPEPGVYPTPLYEALAGIVLFFVLWTFRRHRFRAGWLFSLYLLLAGIERFFIEKIRVNAEYHFLGITATQAEIISLALIAAGLAGLVWFAQKPRTAPEPSASGTN